MDTAGQVWTGGWSQFGIVWSFLWVRGLLFVLLAKSRWVTFDQRIRYYSLKYNNIPTKIRKMNLQFDGLFNDIRYIVRYFYLYILTNLENDYAFVLDDTCRMW